MTSGNKNDLFLLDRQNRNAYDFEGSGVGSGRYDKNIEWKEKIKNSTLPIAFLIVTSVFTVLFMKEVFHCVYVMNHYTKAVVEKGNDYNKFSTPNGVTHIISPNMDVYYPKDNYEAYEEIPKSYILVLGVATIIVIYVLIIRSLYKTFHKTHYSEGSITMYDEDF